MKVLMKCGCAANATDEYGNPCCAIHLGLLSGADIVASTPNLAGRFARCVYFGKAKPRRRYANDECNYGCRGNNVCKCGKVPSSLDLAFFEYKPNEEHDKFYCGCFGWD